MGCSSLNCGGKVSKREFNYSVKHFGKVLCRECQKDYANKEKSYQKQKNRSTPQAIKLCEQLIKMGFNAQLEKNDGYKRIDIAIPDKKINIEVDGGQHNYDEKQALADLKRTYYSFKKGYVTLRIPNRLIEEKAYETAKYIREILNASAKQLEEESKN